MHAQSGQDPGPLTGDRGGSTFGQMVDEKVLAPSAQAQDDTLAERLWERSVQLVGLSTNAPA